MNKALGIIGFAAFILGLILAIIFGIVAPENYWVILILVILGIIIGALNITGREIMPLLLATIALIVVGGVFEPISVLGIGAMIDDILNLVATLMAPAAVIASVRAFWSVGFPGR